MLAYEDLTCNRDFSPRYRGSSYICRNARAGTYAAGAGFPGALAAVLMRRKIILRVVGDYAWEQGMQRFGVEYLLDDFLQKKYGFFVWILRRVQVFLARRAKRIIGPSKYLKSDVEQWGIEGEKKRIFFNNVSLPEALSREEAPLA